MNSSALSLSCGMLKVVAACFVFLGGFAVMVLEIIGARYLARDFGGDFYVWISQIGMILAALALGYAVGGRWADKFKRAAFLAIPLGIAGVFTFFIPDFTPGLLDKIVMRHPLGEPIPDLWKKLDPVLGTTLVFFLPCFVLAVLSPYTIRLAAHDLRQVGTISGLVYAASTIGSIGGVFASGYVLIDIWSITQIFRATGILILCLAGISLLIDRWMARTVTLPAGERVESVEAPR